MSLWRTKVSSPAGTSAEPAAPQDSPERSPQLLDPEHLHDHIDALYRAARAMCGNAHDAEDLVQETFASVLRRPRWLRQGNELAYLLRALRHTYSNRLRIAARRPVTVELLDHQAPASPEDSISSQELMEAIASAPAHYRDAVIAVDLLGLSYREAARSLGAREATVTSRLHRGRQHVSRVLLAATASAA
jgi:RNA polymerase sigma-70 factor (ECF subfamily)